MPNCNNVETADLFHFVFLRKKPLVNHLTSACMRDGLDSCKAGQDSNTVLNTTAWMHMSEIQHPEMLEHSFCQHAKQSLFITLTRLLMLVYHFHGIFELPHNEII